MNNITELLKGVKDIGAGGWEAIKNIGDFLYFLMHPSLIIKALWNFTVVYSFWICLFVALFCTIFYALGFKKLGKFVPASLVVYSFIKTIASAF